MTRERAVWLVCSSLVFLFVVHAANLRAAESASNLQIEWSRSGTQEKPEWFSVVGLDARLVAELNVDGLTPEEWKRVFSVSLDQDDPIQAIDLPAMAGRYAATNSSIVFRPRFPLSAGTKYRAIFNPEDIRYFPGAKDLKLFSRVFEVPEKSTISTTTVTEIYPNADVLPENLLKFYVHFSAPMSSHGIHRYIRLINDEDGPVDLPFLELDDPLWNYDMTQLTLFIDPGRIKREVKPLEEIGPSLVEGKKFKLIIDREWKDATGNRLVDSFEKQFAVAPADRVSPDLNSWSITVPKKATRQPLEIDFHDPMDHALAQRMIRINDKEGVEITGVIQLEQNDSVWKFVPDKKWNDGEYSIAVQTTIEDLAGNNIGKLFEVDLRRETGLRPLPKFARRSFEIR